jgi:tripartite-type tricarboxylate transporter receptor subunit TctC
MALTLPGSFARCVAAALCASSLAAPLAAQTYPVKPIRGIVANAAGGVPDTVLRLLAEKLNPALGQPIVVDNRGGAGGVIASELVAKSPPDGYTLLITAIGALDPVVVARPPYDPIADFAGVAQLADLYGVLVSTPSRNFRTLADLEAFGRANPGVLNFGSSGAGSFTHLQALKLTVDSGFTAVHIPVKGAAQAMTEVLAGRLDFYTPGAVAAIPLIKQGKVRALAVMADRRVSQLPDVPTLAEASGGRPMTLLSSGVGMFVPRATSRDIVGRLNREVVRAGSLPDTRERMETLGATPSTLTPEQLDEVVKATSAQLRQLVKTAGLKPE